MYMYTKLLAYMKWAIRSLEPLAEPWPGSGSGYITACTPQLRHTALDATQILDQAWNDNPKEPHSDSKALVCGSKST